MKKNNTVKLICAIVGGVAMLGATVLALVHFWDDIKSLLPCGKCCAGENAGDFDDFEDVEA